ncbi:TIR domain-containing protein [Plantactinospora soyae]|uniref:Nucleotide-binding protein n=1 Tax=Plantactinospora soyae TaxID=1544732 RepID=A0A927QZK5_9ACTN|nr:nucleotide-binding protein [Plantactinospora soyae]MBE1489167.1 putative nucleotide-binding protein [Plantactinospora soyae]
MTASSWPLDLLGAAGPGADGTVVLDAASVSRLGDTLGLDPGDTRVWMRGLIEQQHPLAAFEMRSGAWRVKLLPAVAVSAMTGLVGAAVLQLMDVTSLPGVLLGLAAGALLNVEQIEVAETDVVVHARLCSAAASGDPQSVAALYASLPEDVREELTLTQFAAVALRLHEIGLVEWTGAGVNLRAADARRGFRLVARAPSAAVMSASFPSRPDTPHELNQRVFVVHGRDDAFVGRMFELLSLLGLRPMEWESLVTAAGRGPSPVLHEVIREGMSRAQAVVVLLTPDDVVHLHPDLRRDQEDGHELIPAGQPRPNVLMELGGALYGFADRTVIVRAGSIRPIADLGGINYIDFDGGEQSRAKLVERLRRAGCAVDDQGTEWRRPTRFEGLGTFTRRPS